MEKESYVAELCSERTIMVLYNEFTYDTKTNEQIVEIRKERKIKGRKLFLEISKLLSADNFAYVRMSASYIQVDLLNTTANLRVSHFYYFERRYIEKEILYITTIEKNNKDLNKRQKGE